MKPLICPQCGGKITNYIASQNFATCGYCETRFLIEPAKQPAARTDFVYDPPPVSSLSPSVITGIVVGALLVIGGIFFIAILSRKQPSQI